MDVTDNKMQQDQTSIFQANRLAIMEYILSDTLHDINNALSVILLEVEFLQLTYLEKKIVEITHALNSLQKYIHSTPNHVYFCQINTCIEQTIKLNSSLLTNNDFIIHFISNDEPLHAPLTPSLLQQVIMNLLIVFIENLPKGKKIIEITSKRFNNDIHIIFEGNNISLLKTDTKIQQQTLFDIGFHMIEKIIKSHKGFIMAENKNKLIICLPAY
jgi:hypothetical protein